LVLIIIDVILYNVMNSYELTLVLPGKVTAAKVKSSKEKLEKVVSTLKGKVTKSEEWGKKDLAYKIKGNTSGNFLFYNIELNPECARELRDKLKMEEEIIRYLIVRVKE
jgi:small subunit ribosomal protein S6